MNDEMQVGRPDLNEAGTRYLAGVGAIDSAQPVDIVVPGRPVQILPVVGSNPARWAVELDDGGWFEISDERVVALDFAPNTVLTGSSAERPLPDGRRVTAGGVTVDLVQPTDRYAHAILGDAIEAAAVEVTGPGPASTGSGGIGSDSTGLLKTVVFGPEPPTVIEQRAAMLADVDGDGAPEVLVTQANGDVGAWLALWSTDGELLAESDPIGRGRRWRNQLAIAPVGPGGETEIVDVRTPHIGGRVQFFAWEGDALVMVASISGFTNHVIRSPNIDLGVAADADGDGRVDIVLPTDDRSQLGVLTRTIGDVEVTARVDLPGRLTSNLGVHETDGRLSFAVGTDENVVRVWSNG